MSDYKPLQITFMADTPADDTALLLINGLQRQCNVSEENKLAVVEACRFIIAHNTPTKTEES